MTITLWILVLVINSGSLLCQTIEERFDAGVELYLSTWKKYLRNGAISRIDPNKPGRFTGINYSSNQIEEVFAHLDLLFQVAQLYRYGDYHDHNPATHPLDWKDYQNDTIKDFIISSLNYLDHAYSDTILGVLPIIGPITASRNSFCGGANWNKVELILTGLVNDVFATLKTQPEDSFRITKYPNLQKVALFPDDNSFNYCGLASPDHQGGDQMIWFKVRLLYYYNLSNWQKALNTILWAAYTIQTDASTGQGLRADFSFHDHGPQLYMTGYGFQGYLRSALQIDRISFFLDQRLLHPNGNTFHLITKYARHLLGHQFLDDSFDFNAMGRHVVFRNSLRVAWTHARMYEYLGRIDPLNDNLYSSVDDQNQDVDTLFFPVFQAHSWQSDYSIFKTDSFLFSIRMASSRVVKQEQSDTGVNSRSRFSSLGATNISRNRNQYYNIISSPGFDWNNLPGTTNTLTDSLQSQGAWGKGAPNFSDYCGGLFHKENGVVGFEVIDMYKYFQTGALIEKPYLWAKKSWFCQKDRIYCLGSGIDVDESDYFSGMYTTVNQTRSHGRIVFKLRGLPYIISLLNETQHYPNPSWNKYVEAVWHDRTGYIFPEDQEVWIGENDTTYTVMENNSPVVIRDTIFKLFIKHTPTHRKYQYKIVPAIDEATFFQSLSTPSQDIVLRNDTNVQAIWHQGEDVLQAVFYSGGTLELGQNEFLKVDKPCIVMVSNYKDPMHKELTIADPEQSHLQVRVGWKIDGWEEEADLVLPQGQYKGKSLTIPFNRDLSSDHQYLYPVMDAYVRDGNYSGQQFGKSGKLVVKNDLPSYQRKSYLKFNLQNVPGNFNGRVVLSMRIGVSPNAKKESFQVRRVEDDNWHESLITHDNRPVPGTGASASAWARFQGLDHLQFDVTDLIHEELNGDKILSLQLASLGATGVFGYFDFYSKDHPDSTKWPRLIFSEKAYEVAVMEDAYCEKGAPGTNFEGNPAYDLKVKLGGNKTRQAFLKFPLSPNVLSYGNQAILKMWCKDLDPLYSPTLTTVSMALHNDWTDSQLNWSNKPIPTEGAEEIHSPKGFSKWDISGPFFNAIYEGKNELSLILQSLSNTYQVFCSENCLLEHRPVIELYNHPFKGDELSERTNLCDNPCYAGVSNIYVTSEGQIRNKLMDCDTSTRWSALSVNGRYQRAHFELLSPTTITGIEIDFYRAAHRLNHFSVGLFDATGNFLNHGDFAFSSDNTVGFQSFGFQGTYQNVKSIVYYGNGNTENDWVSLKEIRFVRDILCQ